MKKTLIITIFFILPIFSFTQTKDKHFVKTTTFTDSLGNDSLQTIQYFDNFGRPQQSISIGVTPNKNDMVQPFVYDSIGRQKKQYLPYPDNNTSGNYQYSAHLQQQNYYDNNFDNSYSYTEVNFDNSPYNRVLKKSVIGEDISQNYIENSFYANTATNVRRFYVGTDNNLNGNNFYEPNKISIKKIRNKQNNTVWTYHNKSGKVVLKVKALSDNPSNLEAINNPLLNRPQDVTLLKTAYAYDKYNRLRYVIPPKAYKKMEQTEGFWHGNASDFVKNNCYYYFYNQKHLLTKKRIPGKGIVILQYDNKNRIRTKQDPNLRQDNLCIFTNYDKLGRILNTGITIADLTLIPDTITINQNDKNNIEKYLSFNYYDNYDSITNTKYNFNSELAYHTKSNKTRGMKTASKIRVLDDEQDIWLTTITYYDYKGRPIQTISDNHKGGTDIVSIKYDYEGNILQSKYKHSVKDNNGDLCSYFYVKTYHYDHAKRLIKVELAQNKHNTNPLTLYELEYNEFGKIISKKLHKSYNNSNFVQTVNFDYNIKGLLKNINNPDNLDDDFFAMSFNYAHNGNISQVNWKSANNEQMKTYNYQYDNINRLVNAEFLPNNKYSVNIEYDLNGNITKLNRKGQTINKTVNPFSGEIQINYNYTTIDSLTYSYNGNKLSAVTDNISNDIITQLNNDFRDNQIRQNNEYTYDNNGNMIYDPNKNISVEYNFIDQPELVIKDDNNKTKYLYTAGGTKLQTIIIKNGNIASKIDYCGNFVYKNDSLSYILTETGRITFEYTDQKTQNQPPIPDSADIIKHYEYHLTDHLGNTRVVFNDEGEILQKNSYYPYGLRISGLSYNNFQFAANKYYYNSKELQTQTNYLDYGFRQLDPQLGRWHSIDKMAETTNSLSPYSYAGNNPVSNVDILGLKYYENSHTPLPLSSYSNKSLYRHTQGLKQVSFAEYCNARFFGNFAGSYISYRNAVLFDGFAKVDGHLVNATEFSSYMSSQGKKGGREFTTKNYEGASLADFLNNYNGDAIPISISAIFGFIRGLFSGTAWETADRTFMNAQALNQGLFEGSLRQVLSRFTWELPQTILGYNAAQGLNLLGGHDVQYFNGATHLRTDLTWLNPFSMGSFITTYGSFNNAGNMIYVNTSADDGCFQHEYSHYIQSQIFGPAYTFLAINSLGNAIVSLISYDLRRHTDFWVEQDANRRGEKYFGEFWKETNLIIPFNEIRWFW